MLDRVAVAIRSAVSWIGGKAMALVDTIWPAQASPVAEIQALFEELPGRVSDLADTALAPAVSAIGDLAVRLNTSPVLDGARETAQALPQAVAGTVGVVTGGVKDLTATLGETLSTTTHTAHDLVTGVLRSPKDAVALTGEAVGDLTKSVAQTTDNVLATTKDLAKGVSAQLTTVTDELNDISPSLIAKIDPKFADLQSARDQLREGAKDFHVALPPLSKIQRPQDLNVPRVSFGGDRLGERFSQSEEIRGACTNCVLQPLNVGLAGAVSGPDGGPSSLGSRLSAAGGSSGGADRGAGPITSAVGSVVGRGDGGAGGGPISGVISSAGSTVGRAVKGLGGRR